VCLSERAALRAFILARADIVLQNLRAGVVEKFGLDGASLTATFDLNGAQAGPRSVVVVNPDGQRDSLLSSFTVTALAAPQLRVNIVGPPVFRASHRTAFDFVVENRGNVDAVAVPLWIAGIPFDAVIEVDSTVASPPQDPGEPNWSLVPLSFTGPTGQYLVLVLPRVPPGTVSRRIYLTVPASDPSFQIVSAVMPKWEEGPDFDACLRDGGIVAAAPCAGGQLGIMNAYAANTPGVYALSGSRVWAKIGWQCEAAGTLPAAIVQAQQALKSGDLGAYGRDIAKVKEELDKARQAAGGGPGGKRPSGTPSPSASPTG